MSINNFFPISEYYSDAIGKKIAENQNTYGITPFAAGNNSGGSTCTNCEGACKGGCKGTCSNSCSG